MGSDQLSALVGSGVISWRNAVRNVLIYECYLHWCERVPKCEALIYVANRFNISDSVVGEIVRKMRRENNKQFNN